MSRPTLAVALVVLAACSDDAPTERNPGKVWLALDGSETQVRLVTTEPPPF
ncbi:MAG: hypothetical protein KBG48_06760 [Kofleriaceae bacterium]|jgi:hypothetical protein|nr:hypothetical protein [Kofleriaceae bacterium]MBP9167069.1 hypothetical protein [Kofleriaceae bacterium]MBP9860217.1 hypothetical protein [Kofleriaceae bacterium]